MAVGPVDVVNSTQCTAIALIQSDEVKMKQSNKVAKIYLMHLPPVRVLELLEEYKIPTPYKEVIIATCIEKLQRYPAIVWISKEYGINISFWQFGDRLRDGLDLFAQTHKMMKRDFSRELII